MVDWTGGGTHFGRKSFQMPLAEKGWATLSRRGIFVSDDGFLGCPRHNKKSAVRRHKTKNSGFKSDY